MAYPGIVSFSRELGANLFIQLKAPLNMTHRQFAYTGLGVLSTGGLMAYDVLIQKQVRFLRDDSKALKIISPYLTELGGNYGVIGAGCLGVFGYFASRPKEYETAYLMMQAVLTSGLWCRLGKVMAGRARPSAAYKHNEYTDIWHGPFSQFKEGHGAWSNYDAFPSGHTATIFSMAAVAACQYEDAGLVSPVIAYSVAGIVGFTRLVEETHWASDVFVGGFLGYLCGKEVVAEHRRIAKSGFTSRAALRSTISVLPFSDGAILAFSYDL